jgi:hypothetical protein
MSIRRETGLVILAALAFGAAFTYPLLLHLRVLTSFWDWDFALELMVAARRSIVQYHQLPLWNPWMCGGAPLLGNPQARILNPFFPLVLIFGPAAGTHLAVWLHLAMTWAGGYVLGRVLGMRPLGAVACASAFASSSWFALHVASGELVMMGFCYFPWLLAFTELAVERRLGWVWPAALALALMWLDGNPYPPSYGALVLAVLAPVLAVQHGSVRPLWVTASVLALGLTLAGPHLMLSYRFAAAHPRPTGLDSGTLHALGVALFSRNQDLQRSSEVMSGWHEIGAYVGLFMALAIAGLSRPRRALPWALLAAVMATLTMGARGPWWPWSLLHKLPVFSWERLPYRFIVPMVQAIAVLAGFGTDWIAAAGGFGVAAALIAIATLDCLWVGTYNLSYSLRNPVPAVTAGDFRQVREPGTGYYVVSRDMLRVTLMNQGIINCNDYSQWKTAVQGNGDPGYRGEQYILGKGTAELLRWTPNRLEFAVDAPGPATLVVNQNYDRFWRLTAGRGSVISQGGLLAVSIPAGKQRLELSYW